MTNWLKSLFSEDSTVSMMRLISLISLMAGIILCFANKPGFEIFVLAAFTGKVAQKITEVKNDK
jgi:hypothetical protein